MRVKVYIFICLFIYFSVQNKYFENIGSPFLGKIRHPCLTEFYHELVELFAYVKIIHSWPINSSIHVNFFGYGEKIYG